MPLYQKKPFPLTEKPKDLKPQERVFQVRFTKEIFRDYSEYLDRINLYRKRVWTCKVTGKTNLTYEEALVSEKIRQFPKEFIVPVLQEIQYSMLTLRDLADAIVEKLQEPFLEGNELYARKNSRVYPCKITKILEDNGETKYEIAWVDKDKKVTGNSLVNEADLIKRQPFTKKVLKSFIKESTCRNAPWVLHAKLAEKHGISTDPPQELKGKISISNGIVICSRKRKKDQVEEDAEARDKSEVLESGKCAEKKQKAQLIKYPIDDLLLDQDEDQHLTKRPSPCKDFNVPMDCVGDLLMVWDFCTSFGRLLNLFPFPLEDLESALSHKEGNVVLIVECHSALLRILLKDNGAFSALIQSKKRKPKITLVTWADYLCDFLEMIGVAELLSHISTIKRGHYGLLDIHTKLGILRELIAKFIETDLFREKLDECIEERQALAATKRGEAIEEGRKRREEKERLKAQANGEEMERITNGTVGKDSADIQDFDPGRQNGIVSKKLNDRTSICQLNQLSDNSEAEQSDGTLKKNIKMQTEDSKATSETDSSRKKNQKSMMDEKKGTNEKKIKEQRKQYLEREIEKRLIRSDPLGRDRNYNSYWFFRRHGRIFIENFDSKEWGYYSSKEELDAFLGSLNPKGERERDLKKQFEKYYDKMCAELQKRSKERLAQRVAVEEAVLRRSTRVRAPPRDNPALAFLKYENKWKDE